MECIKNEVAEYWNQWSGSYDQQYAHGLKSSLEEQAWMNLISDVLGRNPLRILDVGTGTGFLARIASKLGHFGYGIDLSSEMLAQAVEKNHAVNGSFAFEMADAEELPYDNESFDSVINRHLLWTLPNPEKALQEWSRVLKPGGIMLIINAGWSTFGAWNRGLSFCGQCLIAVQEMKNPWKENYSVQLREQLPLIEKVRPEEVKNLLQKVSLQQVSFVNMRDVVEEEMRTMPLRYRLAYRHERYALSAYKTR